MTNTVGTHRACGTDSSLVNILSDQAERPRMKFELRIRWVMLGLMFFWFIGCASPSSKKVRDPFEKNRAEGKFSCGEETPNGPRR